MTTNADIYAACVAPILDPHTDGEFRLRGDIWRVRHQHIRADGSTAYSVAASLGGERMIVIEEFPYLNDEPVSRAYALLDGVSRVIFPEAYYGTIHAYACRACGADLDRFGAVAWLHTNTTDGACENDHQTYIEV